MYKNKKYFIHNIIVILSIYLYSIDFYFLINSLYSRYLRIVIYILIGSSMHYNNDRRDSSNGFMEEN